MIVFITIVGEALEIPSANQPTVLTTRPIPAIWSA
jgi:hypothetical protein